MNEKPKEKNAKQIIDQEYYLRNREQKILAAKRRYRKIKGLREKELAKRVQKYSQVENYKVLITFKEYTLLNKDKQQKWFDFSRTLKDLADNGVHNTSELMRLGELGEILIRDYRETAKKEEFKGKRWQSLSEKNKQEFIKFWAREKVRQELAIAEGLEEIERKGEGLEKEIEAAKFHEERGKIKCECWQCRESKLIQEEVKAQIKKEAANYEKEREKADKQQCPDCKKWVKKLDEENGVCKSCWASYQ